MKLSDERLKEIAEETGWNAKVRESQDMASELLAARKVVEAAKKLDLVATGDEFINILEYSEAEEDLEDALQLYLEAVK